MVSFLRRPSRRVIVGSLLLLTAITLPVEAVAAQLLVTWTNNSTNEDGFKIERSTGTTETFVQIGVTGPDVTLYTDSGLADVTAYCYRVRAYNAAGDSGYSNVTCATTAQNFTLAVVRFGTGNGNVITSPPGLTCGTSCAASYPTGTALTLTVGPVTGSSFKGWSGAGCTGTGPCTVTLTAATIVTATFDLQTFPLTISTVGTGNGIVTSTPAGITCGTSCSGSYPSGTAVTLTASPATGSTFSGWSGGGCTGTGSCTVTLSAATTVTATFTQQTFALTIANAGTGTGTVTSTPAVITCGTSCAGSYPSGTAVTLTAAPATGSTFTGWNGGGRPRTGSCPLTP